MSAALIATRLAGAESAPLPTDPRPGASPPTPLPTVDLATASASDAFATLSTAASTVGVALINNLAVRPPIAAIQRLFTRLYAAPDLVVRLNATYPARGVFKAACLRPGANPAIDQKTTIDLSVRRLGELRRLDPQLVDDLGDDFAVVLAFYAAVERDVLPLLMAATSRIAGADIEPLHREANNNLRLIDYFPRGVPDEARGPRCGEHIDYGTFTVVFQDGAVGGLEFDVDGRWIQVPAAVDAVVSWGWCGAVLSDERVLAAKHRVLRTWPAAERRTTAVVFVAPDLDAPLKPVWNGEEGVKNWRDEILNGDLTVRAFKAIISKKWRRREGNEAGAVVEGAQDREVMDFLKPQRE